MESLAESTPAPTALHYSQYAGFWVRFCATCIDLILFTPVYYGVTYLLGPYNQAVAETAFFIAVLALYAWFFSSRWQGSPGMHLLGFYICDVQGARISFWHALWWGITSAVGWALCCVLILYLQSKFDINGVNDLLTSCKQENLPADDCIREVESFIHVPMQDFLNMLYVSFGVTLVLLVIWALSVALPKDKTGFHNLICRTRFVKGRP